MIGNISAGLFGVGAPATFDLRGGFSTGFSSGFDDIFANT